MFSYKLDDEVELRLLTERDAEEYYAACARNRERFYWLKDDYTLDDARDFLRRDLRDNFAGNNGFQAGVFVGGRLAGCVRYNNVDWEARSTSLGYWLDAAYEGRGIVTRVCRVFIDYAFGTMGLNRLEIRCHAGNARSRAVGEKLGFTLEGVRRQGVRVGDRLVDEAVYSLLAGERPAPPAGGR